MVRGVQDDPRLDLYSFGCIAWELLTGQPVFSGRVMDVMHAHVTVPPRAPSVLRPELPAELDALVLRCLRKEPGERFQNASEIIAALHQLPALRDFETLPIATSELRRSLQAVAEALLDAGCEAPDLVLAGADLEQLAGELRHINAEARELERQHDAAEASARMHECSLRFALGALRSHQDRQIALGELEPATDDKIAQLEARVTGISRDLARTTGVLSDAAIALALRRDEVELKLGEAERALEQALLTSYPRYAEDPGVASAAAQLPVAVRERLRAAGIDL
jgi:hypothetical protein